MREYLKEALGWFLSALGTTFAAVAIYAWFVSINFIVSVDNPDRVIYRSIASGVLALVCFVWQIKLRLGKAAGKDSQEREESN